MADACTIFIERTAPPKIVKRRFAHRPYRAGRSLGSPPRRRRHCAKAPRPTTSWRRRPPAVPVRRSPRPITGPGSMPAAIWALPGAIRIGRQVPAIHGSIDLFQTHRHFRRGRQLLRRASGRLQLHAAEPRSDRRRGRCFVSGLSSEAIAGISIGGTSTFTSPTLGAESFSETVLASGTVRGRIGYAPGQLAVLCDRRIRLDLRSTDADPARDRHNRYAVPVAVGLGRRRRRRGADRAALDRAARISVHRLWQRAHVVLQRRAARSLPIFRCRNCALGLNYQFGNDAAPATAAAQSPRRRPRRTSDNVSLHGQTTFVWQGYPGYPLALSGPNSLARRRRGAARPSTHALRRRAVVAGRRVLGRSGDRSGLRHW